MAINADLARVGVTGAAFVADVGAVAPTGLAVPGVGWVDLGAISDEGLTETRGEDREEWTPWQTVTPIRTEITGATRTFQFTCWESSAAVISLYYQTQLAEMTEATGTVTFSEGPRPAQDRRAFLFDIFDGDNQRRFYLPNAEVTERGDITYASAEIIGYPLTVVAYPDATSGNTIERSFSEGWSLPTP